MSAGGDIQQVEKRNVIPAANRHPSAYSGKGIEAFRVVGNEAISDNSCPLLREPARLAQASDPL